MTKLARTFCILGVLAMIVAADAVPAPTRMVSVGRQLRLKRKLLMGEQSLVATLEANRQRWERLGPTRQEQLRKQAFAFRGADAQQQQQIIAAWEKFHRLSAAQQDSFRRKAVWLKAIIDTLDDSQKQRLLGMTPTERAQQLHELGRQMDAAGAVGSETTVPAPPTT